MHKIIQGDIYAALNALPDNSIDLTITSPPYWAQRNYGFEKQIGSEATYMLFVSRLVYLFNILKNKLTDKGVFFLNIGDKYLQKYGKTPLALIPYKLAYFMQEDGWILNDTIIWYKPNHMPSSVKNRFINAYEPVFIFSKNYSNYFEDFAKDNPNYSSIIDVNLQPTPYKHVAVYPEKLITRLLEFTKIEQDFTVLDPFAGSGTTLKVINDKNKQLISKNKAKGIMIEYNEDYVEIIKHRTKLKNLTVECVAYKDYDYPLLNEAEYNFCNSEVPTALKTVNIFENQADFYCALNTLVSPNFRNSFAKDKLIFVGLKKYSIEAIYRISLLKGWVIRNQLIVREQKWYPIFMLVHDNKICKYSFNYKALASTPKSKPPNYLKQNFIGYRVEDKIHKQKKKGIIITIIESYQDGLPKYVEVLWDTKMVSKEFIINHEELIDTNLKFHKQNGYVSVQELKHLTNLDNIIKVESPSLNGVSYHKNNYTNSIYTGKFSTLERKNWGASPGARSSVETEFFAMQKLYKVDQNLIADYLNYIRRKANLSKKQFTELFPLEYKHTVGHWLRKDFGGSIPVRTDWKKLDNLFEMDRALKDYACKTALKLQTVSISKYKIPDDVITTELIPKLTEL